MAVWYMACETRDARACLCFVRFLYDSTRRLVGLKGIIRARRRVLTNKTVPVNTLLLPKCLLPPPQQGHVEWPQGRLPEQGRIAKVCAVAALMVSVVTR